MKNILCLDNTWLTKTLNKGHTLSYLETRNSTSCSSCSRCGFIRWLDSNGLYKPVMGIFMGGFPGSNAPKLL